MKSYEASSTIAATPDVIWAILTDGASYSRWASGVERVDGRIAPGETIRVYVKVNPGRAFPVSTVSLAGVFSCLDAPTSSVFQAKL